MANDFRLAVDFLEHPKTIKLISQLEAVGVVSLLRLWGFAAKYRPRGQFNNMTDADIELAARWNGEPMAFITALLEIGFLSKQKNGRYSLHNWKERNSFAYYSPERVKRAKKSAAKKWNSDLSSTNQQKRSQRLSSARKRVAILK